MASPSVSFETLHEEMIHDVKLDYYGKRLATASSDRTIKIFDVAGEQQIPLATLEGHDGPVWQVDWAHPKFGNLLASCSYDGRVIVWKEQGNQWTRVFEGTSESGSNSSINAVAWAPHTFGLVLAAASADGFVTVFTHAENDSWTSKSVTRDGPAHKGGVNGVSWGPDVKTGALLANAGASPNAVFSKRFVTGGCDNTIKLWTYRDDTHEWEQKDLQGGHADWVRDVAWAPSLGLPHSTIASCSEDKTVIIWVEENGVWARRETLKFESKVWRVSWSIMGNILAVSQGDNKVSLWKETVDGKWQELAGVREEGKVDS